MRCFRSPWWLPSLGLLVVCVGWLASTSLPEIVAQQKGKKLSGTAEQLLKVGPRPQRPALPPSELPLQFIPHERIALVGNSTAERMNLFGHFETLVQMRFAKLELVIRNFGRPADEVAIRQRSNDYTRLDDPLYAFNPDTFLCFFGWNESFAGPEGVEKFKGDYERFLDEFTNKYPRDDAKSKPRFVLVSPLAFENAGDSMLPGGAKENANLKLYADAVKAVADKRKLAFVDLYTPTLAAFNQEPGLQFTINGCHANEKGDALIGSALEGALFGSATRYEPDSRFERLRAAINDKSWVHLQDYRMVNGWYVYGGRRTWDTETFPGEYLKIRNMAAVRDRYVWDLAQGKQVAAKPDDSETGELFTPQTRFGDPRQKYSEAPELRYLTPQQLIESCTTPPGTKIELFADETKFPELAKPVQLNFDGKGRLWVSCMPSYPQWQPGMPKANDKLVILEDTNGDGKADKSTVFYDQLHCPTGFEFWNGGVLVVDQPRLLFLKDTNGDDKADLVVHLLDGWATDDTHHTCGAFEWSNGGLLHMLEGIATSTTLETPWGPHRNTAGGAYVFDPRTLKIRHFLLPGQYNSWCYVFDEWGQGIVGDGTTSNHHWDTPLSGAMISGRKGMNTVFNNEGMRPALGCEWLVSRALPDSIQKHFTYACVINMNGMPRIDIQEDGAGFAGKRLKLSDGKPDDLIRSTDKHFRPADPQIGPDGALWFGDWANALIGHMQYSQRDPNRDHTRGRIYRLVATDKPLVKPVTQFGKSNAELFEQFREYEWRTRYRARRELRDRPAKELLADLQKWVASLNPSDPVYDRLLCEALWLQQSFHAVSDELLQKVLAAKTPQARAAATHVLSDERELVPNAQAMLIKMAEDDHPRVRTEAMRGLSFFATPEAVAGLVATAKKPLDYWARYTLEVSLSGHENLWRTGYLTGKLTADNPEAKKLLGELLAANKAGGAALPHIVLLLSQEEKTIEQRNKAMTALSSMTGNPNNGRAVFVRNCTACHRVGNGEGQEYGPNLDKVATRLTKYKLVESIIDPNAEVDQKYQSTRIDTLDGKTITGLVVSETPKEVVIFDGKDKKTIKVDDIDERTQLKQSSMPEGQAGAMSPAEFLDLIEYLSRLK
ncbi:PVC-type heme-binding CxxCH protein [Tuwongella immobilis]|uniref:Cytochrome c domain-containing protein n=1 Tax=Tuwongella immobilis TaxID=692036 RepID=A0A6C2YM54_9BACT|nr:PVC-type heme-binding CxxCH protein [Tuwongella immobilis]VIP02002.1 membrane-bound dehydrogenase domain protein : Heme-binding protein OS=Planctomyces limnophilus (strain ATCC 43296 / DSM 3776 / IFAM 1008 / 290) GN=Plim_0902 PE=4 SV=1: Lipase_GDSL_2: HEAT_2: Cytochrom_C [Tuwongella immobilis]VTS00093.1 membrane-bound dehydrogenase domain protein : Heme-binding protein OS=Planctomyces limnophilus (strain ATCC 43296 / DSM 3776 / IFAM 1008 / 290) GN=Plim_0902 PE=4 SV=1: Lipase_GDSL_2: HEAT_2: Cy